MISKLLASLPPKLHVLILLLTLATTSLARVLPLAATRTATSEGRCQSIVNMLFAVNANQEGRDIDHLLANPAVHNFVSDSNKIKYFVATAST
jgi:hypothetical protein